MIDPEATPPHGIPIVPPPRVPDTPPVRDGHHAPQHDRPTPFALPSSDLECIQAARNLKHLCGPNEFRKDPTFRLYLSGLIRARTRLRMQYRNDPTDEPSGELLREVIHLIGPHWT